jgi:hypothetical protein
MIDLAGLAANTLSVILPHVVDYLSQFRSNLRHAIVIVIDRINLTWSGLSNCSVIEKVEMYAWSSTTRR